MNPMLTNFQIELFWEEVGHIQKRNALFFPDDQIKNIKLLKTDKGHILQISEDPPLPEVILSEIQFALKIVSEFDLNSHISIIKSRIS